MDTHDKKRFATRTVAGSFSSDRIQPSASRQGRGLYFESSHAFEGADIQFFDTWGIRIRPEPKLHIETTQRKF